MFFFKYLFFLLKLEWEVVFKNACAHTCTSTSTSGSPNKHPRQRLQTRQPDESSKRNACTYSTIHLYCLKWSQLWPLAPTQPVFNPPPPPHTHRHTHIPWITDLWVMGLHLNACIFKSMCALKLGGWAEGFFGHIGWWGHISHFRP